MLFQPVNIRLKVFSILFKIHSASCDTVLLWSRCSGDLVILATKEFLTNAFFISCNSFFQHKEQGTLLILDLTSQRLPYLTYLILQGWQRAYKLVCFVYYSVGQINMSRLRLIEAIHVMEIP